MLIFTKKSLVALITLLSLSYSEGASFPFCKGKYAINSSNCNRYRKYKPTGKNYESEIPKWDYEDMDEFKRHKVKLTVNVFEHGNTDFGYPSCENLHDGRGYTCGSVGFTTGTNDAYYVVEEYHKVRPGNRLDKYRKELKRLSNLSWDGNGRSSVKNLKGFPQDWKKAACQDPDFVNLQDHIAENMYYKPALKIAKKVGIRSELGRAIFYDTAIQHGWQEDDGVGLPTILRMTGPMGDKCEEEYLEDFIHTRWQMLCCTEDDVWPDSADRTSDLMDLVKRGDFGLNQKIPLDAYGYVITGHEQSNMKC